MRSSRSKPRANVGADERGQPVAIDGDLAHVSDEDRHPVGV
ncbi:MAG: hypothetical protein AB7P03_01955 [Kofleriaceae bacterium]